MKEDNEWDLDYKESNESNTVHDSSQESPDNQGEYDDAQGSTAKTVTHVNEIGVTIRDTAAPIIVLFGEPSCGKTMTLVRLTRWLKKNGYTVEPDPNFRNTDDGGYEEMCNKFPTLINSDIAATRTDTIAFMLLTVRDMYARTICQVLEAPGEAFIGDDYPTYIQQITRLGVPKTWLFFVDAGKDSKSHATYMENICALQRGAISRNDRVLFVCNKADMRLNLHSGGYPVKQQFFNYIKGKYAPAINAFKNDIPIIRWFRPYNFDFVVFSAGAFTPIPGNKLKYIASDDNYPASLWKSIMKTVRG